MAYNSLEEPVVPEEERGLPHSAWGELTRAFDEDTTNSYWQLAFNYEDDEIWTLVKNLAQIKSDSVVHVHAVCRKDNAIITEERGESLYAFARRRGTVPHLFVRRFVAKFLRLFQDFEAEKFVHGNVNPGMFFFPVVWKEPEDLNALDEIPVKLYVSLGYAWEGEILQPQIAPKYCAPEMINPMDFGKRVTIRSDVFSLGMVALELLVGAEKVNRLFAPNDEAFGEELNWYQIHGNIAGADLPSLSDKSLGLNIPSGLADVLNKMLSRKPKDRLRISELLDLLDKTLESDLEYREEEEDENSNPLGDLLPPTLVVTQGNTRLRGASLIEEVFEDSDSGDYARVPKEKSSRSLGSILLEYAEKPYVVYPGSALALVGIMSLIVSFMAEYNFRVPLKIEGVQTSLDLTVASTTSDVLKYARVYLLEEGGSDLEPVREISKESVGETQTYWYFLSKRSRYRIEADGYDPDVAYIEVGKNDVLIENKVKERKELQLPRRVVSCSIDGLEKLSPEERDQCRVFRSFPDPGDFNSANFRLTGDLDDWGEDSYRAGFYRPGYKPERPKTFKPGAPIRLSVPQEKTTGVLSSNDAKLAEEVYALLCAVPCEWSRPDLDLTNWYERVVDGYLNSLDGSLDIEEVRLEFFRFFTNGVVRILERQPLFLETSRQGLWRKTSQAIDYVTKIEDSDYFKIDSNQTDSKPLRERWREWDALVEIANSQNKFEEAILNNRYDLIIDLKNKSGSRSGDGKKSYDDLKSKTNLRDARFSPQIRILSARIFARYALIARILSQYKSDYKASLNEVSSFVYEALDEAKNQLDSVGKNKDVDLYQRTLAQYLKSCVELRLLQDYEQQYANSKGVSVSKNNFTRLVEPESPNVETDGRQETGVSRPSDFMDFNTAAEFFSGMSDEVSKRRARCAELQRFGAKQGEWKLRSRESSVLPANPYVGKSAETEGNLRRLYDKFLNFYFFTKDKSDSVNYWGGVEQRAVIFADTLDEIYQQSVFDLSTTDKDSGRSAKSLSIGDPNYYALYFSDVDGEFLPTVGDITNCFIQTLVDVDKEQTAEGTKETINEVLKDRGKMADVPSQEGKKDAQTHENNPEAEKRVVVRIEAAERFLCDGGKEPFKLKSPIVTPFTRSPGVDGAKSLPSPKAQSK